MAKNLEMSFLLDFYGDVLPDKQREAMELFYDGDYSLTEISEETGITRQGVRDRIVKGEKTILDLEKALGLAAKFSEMKKDAEKLSKRLDELEAQQIDVAEIRALIKKIIESGG